MCTLEKLFHIGQSPRIWEHGPFRRGKKLSPVLPWWDWLWQMDTMGFLRMAWLWLKDVSSPSTVKLDLQGERSSAQLSTEKNRFWHYPNKFLWYHVQTAVLRRMLIGCLFLFLSLNMISAQPILPVLCFCEKPLRTQDQRGLSWRKLYFQSNMQLLQV